MHSPLKSIQAQKFQNPVVVINPCLAEIQKTQVTLEHLVLCFQSHWTSTSYFTNASFTLVTPGEEYKQLFFDLTKAAASNNLLKCRTSQGEGRKFPSDREGYQKEKDFDITYSLCSGLEMV